MARCNENGVYEPDERFELPMPKKGWRGCPLAEIEIADLGTHWIWAVSYQMMTGNCAGRGSPLTDFDRPWGTSRAPTRDAAIAAATADLRISMMKRGDCRDARAVLAWLDTLRPAQLDLFGAAA